MLSPMERKRQGYIHELIVTEENYVNDLQLVTEVSTHTHTPRSHLRPETQLVSARRDDLQDVWGHFFRSSINHCWSVSC